MNDNDFITSNIDDLELHNAIGLIVSMNDYNPVVRSIAQSIYDNGLCPNSIKSILKENKIDRIEDLKNELLDLIIDYIEIVLNDHIVSEKEYKNATLLKIYFKIKEGDFYELKYHKVAEILHRQFERIYIDGVITKEEEIHKFEMQGLFGLGYDQFLEFKQKDHFIKKIYRIFENPRSYTEEEIAEIEQIRHEILENERKRQLRKQLRIELIEKGEISRSDKREPISQDIQDKVWTRDGGKCVQCGSQEKLEFDHIIPFSKGGSNTYRNIQLLCEKCNRSKSDNIG